MVTTLLFLTDISQVVGVTRGIRQPLNRARMVTGDMTVAAALESQGIPFIEEWSYLDAADIERNWDTANELAEHWWDEELGSTTYCGFSLADAAKQELVWPFEASLNARTIYERLLASGGVSQVHAFFLPPVPICRNGPAPTFRAATSVSQAVLRWLAAQKGIPVSGLKSFRPLSNERWRWSPRKLPGETLPAVQISGNRKRVVLMLDATLRGAERVELEQGFASRPDWRVVWLSGWELGSGAFLERAWREHAIGDRLQAAWRAWERSQSTYTGAHPEIFANPFLRFQFERIWTEICAAAQLANKFDVLLDALQPSLVVLGYDAFTLERTLVRMARDKGVPTVSLIHGGLWHSAGARGIAGDADYVMVWGQEDMRQLTTHGVDQTRLNKVGSLLYDKRYRALAPVSRNGERHRSQIAARRGLKLPPDKPVVLLMTASTNAGMAIPIADPALHRKTWDELVALAARRRDLTFVIKPHPAFDHFEFYRYICRSVPESVILRENIGLEAALAASDVGVLVNSCTTAGLEAMLARVPVVFLRTAIYQAAGREDSLEKHGAVPTRSVVELEEIIGRLLHDEGFRKDALSDADVALAEVLGERGRPALDSMCEEFDRIALPPVRDHYCDVPGRSSAITCRLAEATQLLWEAAENETFMSAWQGVVEALKAHPSASEALVERTLFGIMSAIGSNAKDAAELRRRAETCLSTLGKDLAISHAIIRNMLLQAHLTATIRHGNAGQWRAARVFAWKTLRYLPVQALRSGAFRQVLVNSLVGRNRLALLLSNAAAWAKMRILTIWPARYLGVN